MTPLIFGHRLMVARFRRANTIGYKSVQLFMRCRAAKVVIIRAVHRFVF